MKFFTSDLHFDHKNILKFETESRPFSSVEEMNEEIIRNWNLKVGPKDEVYILGDISFGNPTKTYNHLERLNGKKYLIFGNHDSVIKDSKKLKDMFEWVKDYHLLKHEGRKIALFHYPIAVYDGKHYENSLHFYGHVHSNKGTHHPLTTQIERAYNVSMDANNLEPVSYDEIINRLERKLPNEN